MEFLRRFPIKTRLIVSFIFLSLVPVFATGFLLYNRSSRAIQEKIEYYTSEILNQIGKNVEQELARLEYDSIEIMFSNDVQNVLDHYDTLSEWEVLMTEERLQSTLVKKFSFLHDISDVLIYTKDGEKILAYGDQGSNILNYEPMLLENMISKANASGGQPIWVSTNISHEVHKVDLLVNQDDLREGVVLIRAIRSVNSGEIIGTLLLRTNEAYFSKIYDNMDPRIQKFLIINDSGMVISSNVEEWKVGEPFVEPSLVAHVIQKAESNEQGFRDDSVGENLIFFKKSDKTNWYFVSFTPLSYMFEETERILHYTLVVGLMAAILAVGLAMYIARSIYHPISLIHANMVKVQKGDLKVRLYDQGKDELAEVANHFNKMIIEVEALLIQTKHKEKEKRVAELQALQAQVNPHFLSNTLNSVKWLANIQGADNIENLITSLIELLHEVMAKDTVFIHVREEIAYLRHYLNIQAFRYFDKFQVQMDIDPEIEEQRIPKFLLQPIVENAIIHGFSGDKPYGVISIKAWMAEERMHFVITDNGIGMSQGQIDHILRSKGPVKGGFNGIGIGNVIERMEMYYGESGKFQIESSEGAFTRVEMICGMLKEEEV